MKVLEYLLIIAFVLPFYSHAQMEKGQFSQSDFIWFVKNYHPISVQSNLILEKGESTLRMARGSFDPLLESSLNQKNYDGKNYYSLFNGGLKIPTWYGIELKTGFDQNTGEFLNPQNNVPSGGLWYAGISIPIGQGLIIDKRRATLKQAKLYAQSTESERQKLLNNLYFEAIKAYWKWVESWNQYKVYEESVELALRRFEAVKQSFIYGDYPAIDTLESFIQVQNRQISFNQAKLNYTKQSLILSNYLWLENNTPLEVTDSLRPPIFNEIELVQLISSDTLQKTIDELSLIHPEMRLYDFKLANMEIERNLKKEELKPTMNINYNAITEPLGTEGFSTQNYKLGFEFSFPIFLRKQRGDLQLSKLKIQNIELEQQQKLLELRNKVMSYYNEQEILEGQVSLIKNTVNNYDALLQGEKEKFISGESALFLVNTRETKLIQARIKLIELMAKYNISNIGLIWAIGNLYTI